MIVFADHSVLELHAQHVLKTDKHLPNHQRIVGLRVPLHLNDANSLNIDDLVIHVLSRRKSIGRPVQ